MMPLSEIFETINKIVSTESFKKEDCKLKDSIINISKKIIENVEKSKENKENKQEDYCKKGDVEYKQTLDLDIKYKNSVAKRRVSKYLNSPLEYFKSKIENEGMIYSDLVLLIDSLEDLLDETNSKLRLAKRYMERCFSQVKKLEDNFNYEMLDKSMPKDEFIRKYKIIEILSGSKILDINYQPAEDYYNLVNKIVNTK